MDRPELHFAHSRLPPRTAVAFHHTPSLTLLKYANFNFSSL